MYIEQFHITSQKGNTALIVQISKLLVKIQRDNKKKNPRQVLIPEIQGRYFYMQLFLNKFSLLLLRVSVSNEYQQHTLIADFKKRQRLGFVELLVVEGKELLFCFGILGVIFFQCQKNKKGEKHIFKSQHTQSSTIWKADFQENVVYSSSLVRSRG